MFNIKDYEHLENLLKDIKKKMCWECCERTYHFKRGYDGHNARWCCLKCEEGE